MTALNIRLSESALFVLAAAVLPVVASDAVAQALVLDGTSTVNSTPSCLALPHGRRAASIQLWLPADPVASGVLSVDDYWVADVNVQHDGMLRLSGRSGASATLGAAAPMAAGTTLPLAEITLAGGSCRIEIASTTLQARNADVTTLHVTQRQGAALAYMTRLEQQPVANTAPALEELARELLPGEEATMRVVGLEVAARAVAQWLRAGDTPRAATLAAATDERARARGASDEPPSTRLRFELALARAESFQGHPRAALARRRALANELARVFGAHSPIVWDNGVSIGSLEIALGNLNGALETLSVPAPPDADPNVVLAVEQNLSTALLRSGRPDLAVARLSELWTRLAREHGGSSPQALDVAASLAEAHQAAGNADLALEVAVRTFRQLRGAYAADSAEALDALNTLGFLLLRADRRDSAAIVLARALQIDRQRNGDASPIRGRLLHNLAFATLESAPQQAQALLTDALAVTRAASGAESLQALAVALDLAYLAQRRDARRAAEWAADPCAAFERVVTELGARHAAELQMLNFARYGLATCWIRHTARRLPDAQALLGLVHESVVANLGTRDPLAVRSLGARARAELALGDRRAARRSLETMLQLAERARADAGADSLIARFGLQSWATEDDDRAGYRTLAWLQAVDGDLAASLVTSDLARARTLLDRFDRVDGRALSALPAAARAALVAQRQRRHDLDAAIARHAGDVDDLIALEAERIENARQLRTLEAQWPDARAQPRIEDAVARARRRLPSHVALLTLQSTRGHAWAIVARPGRAVQWLSLGDEVQLTEQIAAARAQLDAGASAATRATAGTNADTTLFANLVRPLLPLLRSARELVVVADGPFATLPLEAWPADARGRTRLVERFSVRYAPSLAALGVPDRQPTGTALLALGAVPYASAPPVTTGPFSGRRWEDLPGTAREVILVRDALGARSALLLTGAQASRTRLAAMAASGELLRFGFVHVAAHAFADPQVPDRSAVVLAAAPGAAADDGYLTAAELAGWSMNAELLVLSACETAAAPYEYGNGLTGLAHAALAAGNRQAVLTLWPVSDAATAAFMRRFYRHLRNGAQPALALARAKRESQLAARADERAPSHWAAFILYGR